MSGEFELAAEADGCVVRLRGVINGSLLDDANNALYAADPDSRFRWQLWDFSGVDRLEVSAEELHQLAVDDHEATASNPCQRIAIVGAQSQLAGADRLYGIYASAWTEFETETFETFDDARAWLDTPATRT
jgi:hypothetical protein